MRSNDALTHSPSPPDAQMVLTVDFQTADAVVLARTSQEKPFLDAEKGSDQGYH
jgi:hypothetical protein